MYSTYYTRAVASNKIWKLHFHLPLRYQFVFGSTTLARKHVCRKLICANPSLNSNPKAQ